AHELRNPLAPIRNGLQIMRLAGSDTHAMAQARGMMERQLGHMVRLIDDLLDISRISQNKMELRKGRVLLADVIGSAVEAALPNIFDMFSQVDRSIERTTGGLGIGLALVKGLVEMHGGTVKAESGGSGQGSTFTVRLPALAQPSAASTQRAAEPQRSGAGAR